MTRIDYTNEPNGALTDEGIGSKMCGLPNSPTSRKKIRTLPDAEDLFALDHDSGKRLSPVQ
ncbi:MAG TPA: hypothetical protein VFD48_11510 [Pyrinomonadaceae bacterium]|nr:hypothetical protein [Pyrinomonadaceae bacterium]